MDNSQATAPLAAQGESNRQSLAAPWELHLGFMTMKAGGVEVKPQLKFGGQIGRFKAEAGFGDIRDGLRFDWGARATTSADSTGWALAELHENMRQEIRNNTGQVVSDVSTAVKGAVQEVAPTSCLETRSHMDRLSSNSGQSLWVGAGQALEAAQHLLGGAASEAQSRLSCVAQALGLNVQDLDRILSGASNQNNAQDGVPMSLHLTANVGMALRAQLNLGWEDTRGFHMVGAGGGADAILSTGGEVFAGWHKSGVGMRIVLGIANFTFEYTFPQAKRSETSEFFKSRGSRGSTSSVAAGTGEADCPPTDKAP